MPVEISSFVARINAALAPIVQEQIASGVYGKDPVSTQSRRSFRLSIFNIVKLESLYLRPLHQFASEVPVNRLPLLDLPSSKLLDLKKIVSRFRELNFVYEECFYSEKFWGILFRVLLDPELILKREFFLNEIDRNYRPLRTDYAIMPLESDSIVLLAIELAREPLGFSPYSIHKDEEKLAVKMGASMLKIMGHCYRKGRKFLESLCVYGILAGATDFDVCALYPVFPSLKDPNEISDFYFVFFSSKKYLRYRILEDQSASESDLLCSDSKRDLGLKLQINRPSESTLIPISTASLIDASVDCLIKRSNLFNDFLDCNTAENFLEHSTDHDFKDEDFDILSDEKDLIKNARYFSDDKESDTSEEDFEYEFFEEKTEFSKGFKFTEPNAVEFQCKNIFNFGVVNDEALKVLERLFELVSEQAALIGPIIKNSQFNRKFRYGKKTYKWMKKGRNSSSSKTPLKETKLYPEMHRQISKKSSCPLKRKIKPKTNILTSNSLEFLIKIFEDSKYELFLNEISLNLSVSDQKLNLSNISTISIKKSDSPHELEIYDLEGVKNSDLFPKLIKYSKSLTNDNSTNIISIDLEKIVSLDIFDFEDLETNELQILIGRFFLDIMSAIRILHDRGFVHGDVSPSNVGYNWRLGRWQLFDFNQSRTIKSAANIYYHGGTKHYRSFSYFKFGFFNPIDDLISLALTAKREFKNFPLYAHIWAPFDPLVEQIMICNKDDVPPDLDILYLMAVEAFWNLSKDPNDPSLRTAFPFLKEIKNNQI